VEASSGIVAPYVFFELEGNHIGIEGC